MLVISRKKGESFLIGSDIEVTIVKVEDGNVKLAIAAPKSIPILRKELYIQVQDENIKATSQDTSILKNLKK